MPPKTDLFQTTDTPDVIKLHKVNVTVC